MDLAITFIVLVYSALTVTATSLLPSLLNLESVTQLPESSFSTTIYVIGHGVNVFASLVYVESVDDATLADINEMVYVFDPELAMSKVYEF